MSWKKQANGARGDVLAQLKEQTDIPTNVQSMIEAAVGAAPTIDGKGKLSVTTHGHIDEAHYGVHIGVELLADDKPEPVPAKSPGEDDGA